MGAEAKSCEDGNALAHRIITIEERGREPWAHFGRICQQYCNHTAYPQLLKVLHFIFVVKTNQLRSKLFNMFRDLGAEVCFPAYQVRGISKSQPISVTILNVP